MPTGYTSIIGEGATFEQFVWRCARGMGALFTMRDDDMGADIPAQLEPRVGYLEQVIAENNAAISVLQSLTREQCRARYAEEHTNACARVRERAEAYRKQRQAYDDMRAKVLAWNPPTPEHHGLKSFMLEQLETGVPYEFDAREPPLGNSEQWRQKRLKALTREIADATKDIAEERALCAKRNEWLQRLKASVPVSVWKTPKPTQEHGS